MNKCSGIYRIDFGNGHFYIGSAIDIDKRKRDHRREMKRGIHPNRIVQHCWNKYGVFEFTVLEECVKDGLIVREQFYLDQHCDNPKNVNLVSIAGSNLGLKHSAETRAKISAAKKGHKHSAESRAKMSAAKKGVPLSAETRAKLSAARKGVPKWAEHCAKISAARKGVPLSAEHRAKISATIRRNRCER